MSDSASPCTIACQAPLSTGFSRQEYWSGLPFPSPGHLPYPGIKPAFLMSPALAGRFFTASTTWEAQSISCSVMSDSATPRTVARQAPLSMGFSRQEYWSGLPCPPPGDLSDPGIQPVSLMPPALAVQFFTTSATWEARACTTSLTKMQCTLKQNKTQINRKTNPDTTVLIFSPRYKGIQNFLY